MASNAQKIYLKLPATAVAGSMIQADVAVKNTGDTVWMRRAPDGSTWVLLRKKTLKGIEQSIAPLLRTHDGYGVGRAWPVPKVAFDNYEGMAIEARSDGWRFWLITDDGHRVMARTLLVALDLDALPGHGKSPARGAGLSNKPSVPTP